MNVDTGQMYYGEENIEAARKRGEQIVDMSAQLAQMAEKSNDLYAEMLKASTLAGDFSEAEQLSLRDELLRTF